MTGLVLGHLVNGVVNCVKVMLFCKFCKFELACGCTVFGFNALFCMLLCVGAGLVFIYVLRRSVRNVMLISLFAIFTRSLLEFFFTFVIYDYQGLAQFFYTVIAPQAVWTAVFSLPLCLLFRYLHSRFEPEETRE